MTARLISCKLREARTSIDAEYREGDTGSKERRAETTERSIAKNLNEQPLILANERPVGCQVGRYGSHVSAIDSINNTLVSSSDPSEQRGNPNAGGAIFSFFFASLEYTGFYS